MTSPGSSANVGRTILWDAGFVGAILFDLLLGLFELFDGHLSCDVFLVLESKVSIAKLRGLIPVRRKPEPLVGGDPILRHAAAVLVKNA
jgi:hypothetical protein